MFEKHKGSKESTAPEPENRTPQSAPTAAPAPAPAPVASSSATAMIGRGISISGDVTADSNLKIEGVIEGRSVQSKHDVDISETGKVTASISAKVIRISGEVTGDIAATEKVTIAKSGRVQGNVVAPRVQLEDGALFRGSIDMNPGQAAETRSAGSSSARPTAVDSGGKASASAPAADASSSGARKEPGLTLKSG